MKIVRLESNNILRLEAVEITPEGNTVVIGGQNGAGKTSVLDSILLAMGGRQAKHDKPIHKGALNGNVVVELDDLIVKRSYSQNGTSLKVESKDGASYKSPQTILDKLTGQLTFDPLAWVQMDDTKQLEVIKKITGLNFDELDRKRKEAYDERTLIKREAKRLEAQIEPFEEVERVNVTELYDELKKRKENNDTISRYNDERVQLEMDIEHLKSDLRSKQQELKQLEEVIPKLQHQDITELEDQLKTAGQINAAADKSDKMMELQAEVTIKNRDVDSLSQKIKDIDTQKETSMSQAEFPVKGLSFNEEGVLYKDLPFSQASSAEKLRVSVAIWLAMNPKLKVLLIRDGSLLDRSSLAEMAKMAEDADAQVWIERVGEGKECQVIIEDGRVKE